MDTIKARLTADMKTAMKAGDKPRLATIRMLIAAIKQREIDERREVSDDETMAILTKQAKQRRESIAQYESAGRDDLKAVEEADFLNHSYIGTEHLLLGLLREEEGVGGVLKTLGVSLESARAETMRVLGAGCR